MLETLEFHLFQPNILENWNPLFKVLQIEKSYDTWYVVWAVGWDFICARCWTEACDIFAMFVFDSRATWRKMRNSNWNQCRPEESFISQGRQEVLELHLERCG
jgi:hypothetical protein